MEIGETSGQNTGGLIPQPHGGAIAPPFPKGIAPNPGGRPKVDRRVTDALAELQDAPGATPADCIEAFKAARGVKLCGADHKAIALFRKENNEKSMGQVGAIDLALDRLEGKVTQPIDLSAKVDVFSSISAAHSAALGEPEP